MGLVNISNNFVDRKLTEMTHKDTLDVVFDPKIKRCTQTSTFTDAYAKRALSSPWFVRQAAKFVRNNMRDHENERENEPTPVDFLYPVPEKLLAFLRSSQSSSKDDQINKVGHHRHKTIAVPKEDKTRKQRQKYKNFKLPSSSSMSLHSRSSSPERDLFLPTSELKPLKARQTEPKLPVLQTVHKLYAVAVDYQTYRLGSRSPRYDDTVLSYVAKLAKKVKSQMKALVFDPTDHISIVGFLATIKRTCETNKIHEGGPMWVLPLRERNHSQHVEKLHVREEQYRSTCRRRALQRDPTSQTVSLIA